MRNKLKFLSALMVAVTSLSFNFAVVYAHGAELDSSSDDSSEMHAVDDVLEARVGKFRCTVDSASGTQTCLRVDGSDQPTITLTEEQKQLWEQKVEAEKQEAEQHAEDKLRHEKKQLNALTKVAETQIARAERELKRLSDILDRIKTQRGKLAGSNTSAAGNSDSQATASNPDLSKIDAAITKAEALKKKVEDDLADLKAKRDVILNSLPKNQTVSVDNTSDVVTATVPTTVIKSVKDFQTSVKTLKKDLISFHKGLQDIVKLMRDQLKAIQAEKDKEKKTNTSADSAAGEEEND